MNRLLIVSIAATATIALTGIGLLATGGFSSPQGQSAAKSAPVRSTGVPNIGGPFSLVDHTGKAVTQADFEGRKTLVYFGFTFCPDVCPTALQVMAVALEELGEDADAITPVFITVDPERDDVETMAAYVNHFGDNFVGLTGTPEQIAATAKAYKVYFRKVEDPASSGGYTMDHSSVVYLMGEDGTFLANFTHETLPDRMAARLRQFL
ncbi:SCO family protein [Pyruvatibacter sp.]|uniref:SCO family protein n=1 Tax=Pyruvatibacter sp. TaxID=1981328 RepID=UPI0032EDB910